MESGEGRSRDISQEDTAIRNTGDWIQEAGGGSVGKAVRCYHRIPGGV